MSYSSNPSASGPILLAEHVTVSSIASGESAIGVTEAWEALAARAIEPNPFCQPAFVLAWLAYLPAARNGYVLFAWRRRADGAPRLVGVLPVVCERIRFGLLRIAKQPEIFGAWTPPLLDVDQPENTLHALLSALAERGASSLLLPHLGTVGPVWDAIDRLQSRSGDAVKMLRSHRRAMLITKTPSPIGRDAKRINRYAKQRRRLAKRGSLQFVVADDEALPCFLEQFAVLEAASWKGEQGTAFLSLAGGPSFLSEMLQHARAANLLGVASLLLDRKPIACALFLQSQSSAYYFKIAHDDNYAEYSPGILLTLYLTDFWRGSTDIERVDSLATPDNSLINRFWTDRLQVASILIATRRSGQLGFALAVWFEKGREYARLVTRRLRARPSRLRSTSRKRVGAQPYLSA